MPEQAGPGQASAAARRAGTASRIPRRLAADELVGHGVDGDHDGVVDELTVGDITALEVYISAQPGR
jgi:hypothetical protein